MSIINRFLTVVTEPELKLARDLTAMAIADGEVTPEEKEAISTKGTAKMISQWKTRGYILQLTVDSFQNLKFKG